MSFAAARRVAPRALVVASRVGGASVGGSARATAPPPSSSRPAPATWVLARRGRSTTTAAAAAAAASDADLPAWTRPSWDVRVLFDGDCPLCVREVDFLRARDDGRGRLDLVDIASDAYDPRANRGVDFETAMATIHGITPEGDIITGIEVFERAYAAVGLGWVYAFAKYPALLRVANRVYDFWAERRLAVTGRPAIEEVMEARRARDAAGGATACSLRDAACTDDAR